MSRPLYDDLESEKFGLSGYLVCVRARCRTATKAKIYLLKRGDHANLKDSIAESLTPRQSIARSKKLQKARICPDIIGDALRACRANHGPVENLAPLRGSPFAKKKGGAGGSLVEFHGRMTHG